MYVILISDDEHVRVSQLHSVQQAKDIGGGVRAVIK